MRLILLAVFGSLGALSQPFSFGVKGGVPLTDFVSAASAGRFSFTSSTNRYIVGPTAELRLPLGLGVEFDALYRRLHYDGQSFSIDTFSTSRTTGNLWEFPLLLKYRLPTRIVRPYLDAGVAWDSLTGLEQTVTTTVIPTRMSSSVTTSNPSELQHNTTIGFVAGIGLDIHVLLHISPEVRYTRWNSRNIIDAVGLLQSKQDQAEFLVGITF